MSREVKLMRCEGTYRKKGCGELFPATPEYFHTVSKWSKKLGRKKFYLRKICKNCRNRKARETAMNQSSYIKAARIVHREMKKEGINV